MLYTVSYNESSSQKLLAEIYQNLNTGSENLTNIVSLVKDKFLLREITFQLEEYAAHTRQTVSMMSDYGLTPCKPTLLQRALSKGSILLNTLTDSSDSHIAELIVHGTAQGASRLSQTVERLAKQGCDDRVVQLGRDVVMFEHIGADRAQEYR